jgi:hypothetical protein
LVKIVGAKVWEFGFWEVKLGVGILPEEEVAKSEFPAGANHKVDVWEILVEIFGEIWIITYLCGALMKNFNHVRV